MASASYRGRMIVNDTDYTGSFVDPNPSGVATDDLNTVAIDGKIFNVVGSGGGGGGSGLPIFKEVTLYNAPDRTWRDITLADSLLNYDLVLFHVHDTTYNGSDANHQHEGALVFTKQELIDCYNDTKVLWLMGYDNTYALYTLTDYQTLTATTQVSVFIQRITGIKFGTRNGDTTVLGSFIDTNRVIQAFTNITDTQEHTYTATEDCVVTYYIPANTNSDVFIKIDNVQVGGGYSQYINAFSDYCFLKKGQTFSYQTTYTASSGAGYTVYGIQGGDSQLIAPVIYSTTEREIGVWADNKPLYEKTIIYDTALAYRTWVTVFEDSSITIQDYEGIIYLNGTPYSDLNYHRGADGNEYVCSASNGGYRIQVNQSFNGYTVTCRVTIRYTKNSDVAGSGTYNTLGTPMQHYSTTEEVIGTWIDGRTLYRRVYDFTSSPITVPTNTWLKVANDWQIQPIRGTGIVTSSRATFEVAIDCDDNDGLYVRSWLNYGNVNYLIVEYVKD